MLKSPEPPRNALDLFGFNDPASKATFKNNIVFHTIVVASIGCTILSIIFFRTENWLDLWVTIGALLLLAIAFVLFWNGKVNIAIRVKLFGAFILMWAGVYSQGGINDAGFQILYPIFIFTVALTPLFVHRMMGIATVILLFILMYLEQIGFFATRPDPNSGIVEGLVILNVLVILYFSTQFFVSRLQETQQNLLSAKADLEKLIAEKNAFLSMLTHDMKTPLTTIGIYSELLESNPELARDKPRITKAISSSQKNLVNLVNDILEIEQMQLGNQLELKKESINMQSVLKEWVLELEEIASEKECELILDSAINDPIVIGDQARLQRVFSNLATNAIKYSPNGSPIHISLESDQKDQVLLKVADKGFGIPSDDIPFIFDLYHRSDANLDKAEGSGVGLAIVKAIVEAHEGKIEVESKESAGSTFTVALPLASGAGSASISATG